MRQLAVPHHVLTRHLFPGVLPEHLSHGIVCRHSMPILAHPCKVSTVALAAQSCCPCCPRPQACPSASQGFRPRLSLPPMTRGCWEWSSLCAHMLSALLLPPVLSVGRPMRHRDLPRGRQHSPKPRRSGARPTAGALGPTSATRWLCGLPSLCHTQLSCERGSSWHPRPTTKVSLRVDSVWQSAQGGPGRTCCWPAVSEACHPAPLLGTGSPAVMASDDLSCTPVWGPIPGAYVGRCW